MKAFEIGDTVNTSLDSEENPVTQGFANGGDMFEHGATCEDCGAMLYPAWCEGCADCSKGGAS